jgi:hypothetical protein
MTRLWAEGLPIKVQRQPSDGAPARIRIEGRTLEVDRIVQMWQVGGDWWAEKPTNERLYYSLITRDKMLCVIFIDLEAGGWFLSKVYD